MRKFTIIIILICLFGFSNSAAIAQNLATDDEVLKQIWTEAMDNSQLKQLAHELLDVIGPRLVGTPQMKKAHDWAVEKYKGWGISARNEEWGKWRGWRRGISHIDMMEPRVRTLEGTMMAWSPGTLGPLKASCIIMPDVADSIEFENWLPNVNGKFVLISMPQPTGRTDDNWEEFATEESFEKMKEERQKLRDDWRERVKKAGYNRRTLPKAIEDAGAAGIIASRWSNGWGVNKVLGTTTQRIPTVDLSLEDYGLVYRLVEHGDNPIIRIIADAEFLGEVPTFNTIAEIKGTEKPDEYVILSAHFDSWDGASGATDNGTGTLTMMEAMRILKKSYPKPKRTILVGHWGSEEQGLNGSRAFVEDHPEIVENLQVFVNQDNGTGRVVRISGQGLIDAGMFLAKWLARVPSEVTRQINLRLPGRPSRGGSDNASFVAAGAPAFSIGSLSWDYGTYTWHTNRDTYDKLVFDDLMNNVVLAASLAYLASEDPELVSREKRVMPVNQETGKPRPWPTPREPNRRGGFPKEDNRN